MTEWALRELDRSNDNTVSYGLASESSEDCSLGSKLKIERNYVCIWVLCTALRQF